MPWREARQVMVRYKILFELAFTHFDRMASCDHRAVVRQSQELNDAKDKASADAAVLKNLEAQISELKTKQIAALEKALEEEKAKVSQLRMENVARGREVANMGESLKKVAGRLERCEEEKTAVVGQCRAFAEKMRGKRPQVRAEAVWDALHGPAMEGYLAEFIVAERSTGFALAISQAQHLGAFVEGFDPTASLSLAKDEKMQDVVPEAASSGPPSTC